VRQYRAAEGQLPGLARLGGNVALPAPRAAARPLPLGAQVALLTTPAELAAIESDWRAIEAEAAQSHNVFQSFDWVTAWARTYATAGTGVSLCVVAGRVAGRLVFLLPLMRCRRGPVTLLQWLSDPLGQYGDIILAAGEDAAPWMQAALRLLRTESGTDVIRLRHVRQDAAVLPALGGRFRPARVADGAPYMDLRQFAGDTAYEQRYSKEQRKRRKRIRRELEALGPLSFTLVTGAAGVAAIAQAVAQKQLWLKERRLVSRAMSCPRIGAFLQELAEAGGGLTLVTSVLAAGGRPVAWEVGLRFKDRHLGFITAHDVALTDKSPARLHMDLSQRRALADGMAVFDLMVPIDPHKESWASGVVPVEDYYRALTFRGWLYGRLYLETLRPLLRQAYYKSSAQFRGLICRIGLLSALIMH
jgi:CelD/BcsL family acetyltransferase involved in cellulose biosynthesis